VITIIDREATLELAPGYPFPTTVVVPTRVDVVYDMIYTGRRFHHYMHAYVMEVVIWRLGKQVGR
jgi:hypothetical protein